MRIRVVTIFSTLLALAAICCGQTGSRFLPISVDSVADLQALRFEPAARYDERIVRVNDRGGFYVRYDKDSVAVEDNGFVFDAAVGKFLAIDQSVANIVQFGAVSGGNAITNTIAIQNAMATGKPVYVPEGDYAVQSSLGLVSNSTIFGDGEGSIITATTTDNIFDGNTVNDVRIEGLHLVQEGSDLAGDITIGNCVYLQTCRNVTIAKCEFENYCSSAVQIRTCKNTAFTDNFCHDASSDAETGQSSDFLSWGSNDGITVRGNRLVTNVSQNIYIGALPGDRAVVVTGNYCDTLDANGDELWPTAPADWVVSTAYNPGDYVRSAVDGKYYQTAGGGVSAGTANDLDDGSDTGISDWKIVFIKRHSIIASYQTSETEPQIETIANNVCRNTTWTGIYVNGNGHTVNITGNVCYNNAKNIENSLASAIHVAAGKSTNINITANTVSNTHGSAPKGQACIKIAPMNDNADTAGRVLVSSNMLSDSTCPGMRITNYAGHVHVVGNQVNRCGTRGILIDTQGRGDGIITGNRIECEGADRGIFVGSHVNRSDAWLISNNEIMNTAIVDGDFDASSGTFPRAANDQILIVGTAGTIDGLVMSVGDWVESEADQGATSSAANWNIIADEAGGLTDAECCGIYLQDFNASITGNVIRGFTAGIYPSVSQTTRNLDPPRIYQNHFRDCHAGVNVLGSSNGLLPVSPTNRFEGVEAVFGDDYVTGGLLAELREGGLIRFSAPSIPAASARFVAGDVAENSAYDGVGAASWHYDGTAWNALIP